VYGVLITIAALGGVLISARHIWIQAQPPGTVAACGADLDYLLEIMPVTQVVTKVLTGSGECGKVDWTLLGLSMPWWVAISLGVLALWALVVNFRKSA
jgi:disulfide bond formation protein DsbB